MSESTERKWYWKVVQFIINTVGLCFLGALVFLGIAALEESGVLPRFVDWIHSFPMWGVVVFYLILGAVAYKLYKWLQPSFEKMGDSERGWFS